CGHPQASWLSAVAAGIWAVARRAGPPWRASLRALGADLGRIAAAGAWAVLLVAAQLLPFLELLGQGNRGRTPEFVAAWSLEWGDLPGLIRPVPEGLPPGVKPLVHVGVVIAVAGGIGLASWRRERRALGLIAVGGVLSALAAKTPLFPVLY